MKGWNRISTDADFRFLQVYEKGPVCRIEFLNREIFSTKAGALRLVLFFIVWAVAILLMAILGKLLQRIGIPWFVTVIAIAAGLWWLWGRLQTPPFVPRAIELDREKDEIRVYRGEELTVRRKLSNMESLTVAEHPLGQLERQRYPDKMGPYQKSHALFGFFGARGSERVELVSRYEFPVEMTLLDVREAIGWALAHRTRAGAPMFREE